MFPGVVSHNLGYIYIYKKRKKKRTKVCVYIYILRVQDGGMVVDVHVEDGLMKKRKGRRKKNRFERTVDGLNTYFVGWVSAGRNRRKYADGFRSARQLERLGGTRQDSAGTSLM
jgi:hypothetical protein